MQLATMMELHFPSRLTGSISSELKSGTVQTWKMLKNCNALIA